MTITKAQLADTSDSIRAWFLGVSWVAVLGAVATILSAGYYTHDYRTMAEAITALILALAPTPLNGKVVLELVRTAMIRRGMLSVPAGESPIITPNK